MTCPIQSRDHGNLFMFPLYPETYQQTLFTLGSWCWVYFLIFAASKTINQKFTQSHYELVQGSAMWTYISHYTLILFAGRLTIMNAQFSFAMNTLAMFLLGEVFIFLTYLMLLRMHSVLSKSCRRAKR